MAAVPATWPLVRVQLRPDGTGTVHVNEHASACAAASTARLRAGALARAVAVARTVGRPVRVVLADATGASLLAAHPDGTLRTLPAEGAGAPVDVPPAPCRRCGADQPVAALACGACGTLEPLRVETDPVALLDAATLSRPDEGLLASLPAPRPVPALPTVPDALPDGLPHGLRDGLSPVSVPVPPDGRSPVSVPVLPPEPAAGGAARDAADTSGGHVLVLTVDGGAPVRVPGGASLGRDPVAPTGRTPVRVVGATVSKTHALVDVEPDGTILVTDFSSTNGTHVLLDAPVRLVPHTPVAVPAGTVVLLGEVRCTLGLSA
ncbi:FHA domain-containing protein [Cellulomonas algicola]|uniref:FHA domain-containing protein n=1 Tax=Cellulomonas algicola TaxID=2071633 RepID=UPI001C3FDFE4|nr:FHA domain-containing protein [Cellulomonas algicola]